MLNIERIKTKDESSEHGWNSSKVIPSMEVKTKRLLSHDLHTSSLVKS